MLVDYNDGKIHGWNGGECPVHPNTLVLYWVRGSYFDKDQAGKLSWGHSIEISDIIAFQVTKVYREPKTIWVNEYPQEFFAHNSEAKAKSLSGSSTIRIAA